MNSSSGEIKFGNLVDVIDIKTVENIENNKSQTLINEYLENGNLFPINDKFSKIITVPGSYQIVADIVSNDLSNISTSGIFTVK